MNAIASSLLIVALGAGSIAFITLTVGRVAHLFQLSEYVASCIPRRGGGSSQEPSSPTPTPTPTSSPSPNR